MAVAETISDKVARQCYILIHWMVKKICDEQVFYYDGEKTKIGREGERDEFGIRSVYYPSEKDIYTEEWLKQVRAEMTKIDTAWEKSC